MKGYKMALDKKALLKAIELKRETVKLDDGEIVIRQIPASEYMDLYENPLAKTDGKFDGVKFTALLATRCIVDDTDARVLEDADADALLQGASSTFSKIGAAVKRLNGLTGDEAKN